MHSRVFCIFAPMQGDKNQLYYRSHKRPTGNPRGRPQNKIKHSNYSIRIPDVWLDSLRDYANSRNISTNALVISIMRYALGKYIFSKVYYNPNTRYSVKTNTWVGSGRVVCPYCRKIHEIHWGKHPVREVISCDCERDFKSAFPLTDFINTQPPESFIKGWETTSGEPHISWGKSNEDQV